MNILYVNGHPYAKSFHSAIQKTYVDGASQRHTVKVLELGKADFDPILRYGYAKRMPDDPFIQNSQELIVWADHIVFAFPLWWGDAPALLKGWVERVFTPGVAYHVHGTSIQQLLKGRTADLLITSRGVRPLYWLFGNHGVSIFLHNIFMLCGLKKRRITTLGGVGLIPRTDNQKRREKFLTKVARRAQRI